jgi:hypothetical protein
MIDLIYYKKNYFNNNVFVTKNELLNDIRNIGLKENKKINKNILDYNSISSIDLLKIISDKVFFYDDDKSNSSIKNMLYQNYLFYQDFHQETQIESYLYRLINEKINRTLIFVGNFSNKNHQDRISKDSILELRNNMDNDIIYLSTQIILIRYQVYLPWLWGCRKNPFEYLKNLNKIDNKIKIYYLKNHWTFNNV